MREDQKAEIVQSIDALTVHGLSRVFSSSTKFGKIIWLMIWLSASCWLVMITCRLVRKHFSWKVILQQDIILEKEMQFPAMTFCNTNFLGHSLDGNPLPKNCINKTNHKFTSKLDEIHFNKACDMFMARSELNTCTINVKSCTFPAYFSPQKNFFPCYTLNLDGALKQRLVTGSFYGINMIMYFNDSESTVATPDDKFPTTELMDGIYLAIHDQRLFANGLIKEGIALSPGHHILISLRKMNVTKKPHPFQSGCVADGDEKYRKLFPGKHNINLCMTSCFFLKFYKQCGSVHYMAKFLMKEAEYPMKKNLTEAEQKKCYSKLFDDFDYRNCNCSMPCHQVIYEAKVTSKPWPPQWFETQNLELFAKALNKTPSEIIIKDFKKQFLKVSIYFDDFATYVQREEEAYGWDSLLSDLGGDMGLFLGMSLISIVEMFLLLWGVARAVFINRRKKQVDQIKVCAADAAME